jgi:leader peptidase (prepilin peptidase)/N-methyltransferase
MQDDAGIPFGWLVGFAFVFGACIGSFLNVVIWRLPRGESLITPASRCPGCQSAIPAWANVPILSYLALRGRCRSCRTPISARYPIVEALTGAIFAALLYVHGPSARLVVDWTIAAALIAVIFIDLDHYIIPNAITLPGLVLGLALSIVAPSLGVGFWDALAGVVISGGLFWLIAEVYPRLRGKQGLGFGDVKLIAMLASLLGLSAALGIIFVGSVIGLAYGIPKLLIERKGFDTRIPFGPGLAIAGLLFLFEPELWTRLTTVP